MALQLPATADDYRELARRRLPAFLFDYIDGGASGEQTLRANVADWAQVGLRQRVLVNVDGVDARTTLLGQSSTMPLALAPVGMAGLMARRGEVHAARAARTVGVPFTLSTVGICAMDEVMPHMSPERPLCFQLYMLRDRGIVKALLQRAWQAGCKTLIFTVDLPVSGMRCRDIRHGLNAPGPVGGLIRAQQLLARPSWVWNVGLLGRPHRFGNLTDQVPQANSMDAIKTWIDTQFDPSVTWADIDWLRGQWQGAIYLKGILEVDDARAAVQAGVQGLIVSNHGGRQLDGVASTASKLPHIAQAVGPQVEVLVDGGIRNGVDMFRALALGARGVLVGRPWAWALAARGEQGVAELLSRWKQEFELALAMTGARHVAGIGREHLDITGG